MTWKKILICIIFLFFIVPAVHAEDQGYKNDYKVEYFVTEHNDTLKTRVKFTVLITNLRTTEFVDKVGLTFPDTFKISDVAAADQKGNIKPDIVTKEGKINITVAFNDPEFGQNSKNAFALEFTQDNLFRRFGNVWEVILPTISNTTSYKVVVHLPPSTNKKISIAKPKPDTIDGNQITWLNPQSKTIYALFGGTQYYSLNLQYHLENPKLVPVYEDVAFPPDTLYQKMYLNSIEPTPAEVKIDEDGNLLGRYYLKPKQKIDIFYKGDAELHVAPREEVVPVTRELLKKQKSYLDASTKYWNANSSGATADLSTAAEIYAHLVKSFRYNYERLESSLTRLGAKEALVKPDLAVCTEFTDTFVSLARNKGLYAREIEGYGFTQDQRLRPLSLVSDVLHAWPEYYDTETDLWKPVDPTWENTSGIDYFTSFDLNHIVFAIHGKDDEYPYPAGSYKLEDSKDISVDVISEKPAEKISLTILKANLPSHITDREKSNLKFSIQNKSNVYIWNTPITISHKNIKVGTTSVIIDSLPPYGTKEFSVPIYSDQVKKQLNASLQLTVFDNVIYQGAVIIVPYYYKIALYISVIVIAITFIYFFLRYLRRIFF